MLAEMSKPIGQEEKQGSLFISWAVAASQAGQGKRREWGASRQLRPRLKVMSGNVKILGIKRSRPMPVRGVAGNPKKDSFLSSWK